MPEKLTLQQVEGILEKNNKIGAKPDDIKAMIQAFNEEPELWHQIGNMVQQNIDHIMSKENGWPTLAAEATRRGVDFKRKELGFEASPMLEKLVIEAITLAWVHWQDIEYKYSAVHRGEGMTFTKGVYWEKRLSAAQGRFLRACECLARIRRLAPTLQVNIAAAGGQQVNIAGDLVHQGPTIDKKK